jgi:hypothetical protein
MNELEIKPERYYGYLIPYHYDYKFHGIDDIIVIAEQFSLMMNGFYILGFENFQGKKISKNKINDFAYDRGENYYVEGEEIKLFNGNIFFNENDLLKPYIISDLRIKYNYGYVFFKNKEIAILSKMLFLNEIIEGDFDLVRLDSTLWDTHIKINLDKEILNFYKEKYLHKLI